jgi:rubrerythrin
MVSKEAVRLLEKRYKQKTVYQCKYCGWKTSSPSRVCNRCLIELGYRDLKPLPKWLLEKKRRQW